MGIQQNYLYRVLPAPAEGRARAQGGPRLAPAARLPSRQALDFYLKSAYRLDQAQLSTASRSSLSSFTVASIFAWAKSPTSWPSTIS